jgi:tRNA-dihydrouridine synthase A
MRKTVSVAPMMDCTDKHEIYFLSLISKNIHLYSEMIVANAIIRGDRNKLLSFKKISNPVTLQVGGSNPNELAEACKISEDYGYSEINLNLGCPSKKVQKNKFGACLMQNQSLLQNVLKLWQKQQSYQ